MITGMLWYDNDKTTPLNKKIDRAVQYYARKYGQKPTVCFVHPSLLEGDKPQEGKPSLMKVEPSKMVLKHHFWLGTEAKE